MNRRSLVFVGLPSSGKTTYLAALWHQLTSHEIKTKLALSRLGDADRTYLNQIVQDWQAGKAQQRTRVDKSVSLFLKDGMADELELVVPDLAGENFVRMWENRIVDSDKIESLRLGDVLLFVHADLVVFPRWVVDDAAMAQAVGEAPRSVVIQEWNPAHSPTQVKLVDLLQLLRRPPLDRGPRRLVIALSAWDRAEALGLTPGQFLASRLSLLNQYLTSNNDQWDWTVFGISAQGGNYLGEEGLPASDMETLKKLQRMDTPSNRAYVVTGAERVADLTVPLAWILGSR